MKVLITGAHFTPAAATIEQLKKISRADIIYIGRTTTREGDEAKSVESQVLPKMGVKFIPIIAGRLQRQLTVFTIPSLLKIPIGFMQALFFILREQPDVILSFGGYVAVPVVVAGWLFSVPVIIHEQTLLSGLANRISALFADKIAVSFQNTFKGEKVILTGNPIRPEVVQKPVSKTKLPTILVMGGNQGSHVINLAVEQCLQKLLKIANVYHQTGDSKFKDYERLERWSGDPVSSAGKYQIKKWIGEEYPEVLSRADLVVSRAGINTLSELALLGKPALLIPISNREQNKNASFFEGLGLSKTLPQSKLSGEELLKNIKQMLNNLSFLKQKAKEAGKVIIPDAAKRLALETLLLSKSKTEPAL
jgi:UDP-N-acetylglucosamine--N-acetylmuramyl-(pentapeptide) pyrophosphoryl-undecaprenol N-acetylglucosamine transferase